MVNKECVGGEGYVAAQQLRGFIEIKVVAVFLRVMTCPVDKAGAGFYYLVRYERLFSPLISL